MEKNLSIYCITDLESPFLESLNYVIVDVVFKEHIFKKK